jgi:hypothetical protein
MLAIVACGIGAFPRSSTMRWFGWLNYLVLRWFWLRLARVTDEAGEETGWTIIFPIRPSALWEK